MARGGLKSRISRSEVDPIYKSLLLSKFINNVMMDGKKTVAQAQVYKALDILKEQGKDSLATFEKAIENVGPKVEVKARRIGGAAYQVPTEVRGPRKVSLAIRWILESARKRSNAEFHSFAEKLAAELTAAANNEGDSIRKRDTAHKQAEANKAFGHFRW
jgi:small subunit ribosomal protein S7